MSNPSFNHGNNERNRKGLNGLKATLLRHKEIWYGVTIGLCSWALDAMMHASLHRPMTWRGFMRELVSSDSAQLLFRVLFVILASAFGFSLWRNNMRKSQVQEIRNSVDSFYRQIANPLLLITGYSQMLSLRWGCPVGRETLEIIRQIHLNAEKINEAIKNLPPPGMPVAEDLFGGLAPGNTFPAVVVSGDQEPGYTHPQAVSKGGGTL